MSLIWYWKYSTVKWLQDVINDASISCTCLSHLDINVFQSYTLDKQERRFVTWKEQQLLLLRMDLWLFGILVEEYEYFPQIFEYECEYLYVRWQIFEYEYTPVNSNWFMLFIVFSFLHIHGYDLLSLLCYLEREWAKAGVEQMPLWTLNGCYFIRFSSQSVFLGTLYFPGWRCASSTLRCLESDSRAPTPKFAHRRRCVTECLLFKSQRSRAAAGSQRACHCLEQVFRNVIVVRVWPSSFFHVLSFV